MLYVSTKSSYYYSFRKEKELRNSGETRHGKKHYASTTLFSIRLRR